jgi:hypothetical protein
MEGGCGLKVQPRSGVRSHNVDRVDGGSGPPRGRKGGSELRAQSHSHDADNSEMVVF